MQKSQEQLDLHSDQFDKVDLQIATAESSINRLSRLDSKINRNAENIDKAQDALNTIRRNVTDNSRTTRRDIDDILSKFDSNSEYLENRINAEITEIQKLTVRNAKEIVKVSADLTGKVESTATIIDSRLTEDESKLANLQGTFEQRRFKIDDSILAIITAQGDQSTMTEILTETSRKLAGELRNLAIKTDKETQILEDKLSLPIGIQQKKTASLEQLVISEIEKLETNVEAVKESSEALNSTLTRLSSRVQARVSIPLL